MRYLVATASVHLSASACDYLLDHLDEGDTVYAMNVVTGDDSAERQEGQEALNVLRVRLAGRAAVETRQVSGAVADEVLSFARQNDVDELVIGARRGDPGEEAAVGTAAREVLATAGRPVVVVPLEAL